MKQLFHQLPPQPSALGRGDAAHPTASPTFPVRSLPQVLLVEPLASALGEGPIRGALLPHEGLPCAWLHGSARCDLGAAVLGAASGTGRKRQLKAKGERLQRRCLIRENLCLVGLCLASLWGGNLGAPGKPAGKEPWGNNGALHLSSCAHPAPVPPRPH